MNRWRFSASTSFRPPWPLPAPRSSRGPSLLRRRRRISPRRRPSRWRRSGRRYIASIYEAHACPAYCDAALIAVAANCHGERRIVALADTGAFPEPVVARLAQTLAPAAERLEFHLHLLAATSAERRAALDDLAASAPYAARS